MTNMSDDRFDLTPRQVVEYLDRYIVGQEKAKKSVAIALRNRIRRRRLSPEIAREVAPKNILMVGPTGVGKTEIARRLADLVKAPFVKVEATKFTEVGYVGRDVESMVRDLAEGSVAMVKKRKLEDVQAPAAERAEQRLADALLPRQEKRSSVPDFMKIFGGGAGTEKEQEKESSAEEDRMRDSTRRKILSLLREGKLDDREVEIDVTESQSMGIPVLGGAGMDSMGINIGDMLGGLLPKKTKRRRMKVSEARSMLKAEEAEKLVDMDAVTREAIDKAQEEGIIFLDEIDKIVARGGSSGPDVSREGVQRDLLPIVEGSPVQTKYGTVNTDHILFITAGALELSKCIDDDTPRYSDPVGHLAGNNYSLERAKLADDVLHRLHFRVGKRSHCHLDDEPFACPLLYVLCPFVENFDPHKCGKILRKYKVAHGEGLEEPDEKKRAEPLCSSIDRNIEHVLFRCFLAGVVKEIGVSLAQYRLTVLVHPFDEYLGHVPLVNEVGNLFRMVLRYP
jgi:ATP-dependent HslUV protease ATP-binding subunit HslU